MATFIGLISLTDQGIRNVKDSPRRFEAFQGMAERLGVTVKDVYYTLGQYDMLVIMEGPEDAVTAALLTVSSLGNVRSQTLRGFSLDEMKGLISAMP